MRKTAVAATLAVGLMLPAGLAAQGGPGFLFKNPRVSIGFRAGYQLPRVDSNVFDFALDSLTLSRSDFDSPYFGGEIAVRVADRWDLAISGGWARARSLSEYVNWVDQDGYPIEQETTFETTSGSLGAKYYFFDRGRSIGRFAWVPSRFTPYLAGGVGVVWYQFEQAGDWVDFQTLEVFPDRLRTTGSGASGHLAAGADIALGKQFVLTGEARFTLANGSVGGPYSSFDRIDLAGLQLIGGLAVRW